MSLWSLAPSPMMLGMNLPDNDDWTLSLLTNDEALAINQDALGRPAGRVAQVGTTEVWVKDLADGSKAVGLFNRGAQAADLSMDWTAAKLTGRQTVRDVWQHKDLGTLDAQYTQAAVPAHGSVLLRLQAAKQGDTAAHWRQ
jgi:alpha-galactosidase